MFLALVIREVPVIEISIKAKCIRLLPLNTYYLHVASAKSNQLLTQKDFKEQGKP